MRPSGLGFNLINVTADLSLGQNILRHSATVLGLSVQWQTASLVLEQAFYEACSDERWSRRLPSHCPDVAECVVEPLSVALMGLLSRLRWWAAHESRRLARSDAGPALHAVVESVGLPIGQNAVSSVGGGAVTLDCTTLHDQLRAMKNRRCAPLLIPSLSCINALGFMGDTQVRQAHAAQLTAEVLPSVPFDRWYFEDGYGYHRSHILAHIVRAVFDKYSYGPLSGAEIGVNLALTSAFLLGNFPALKLLLVDPFLAEKRGNGSVLEKARANIRPFLSRATLVLQKSLEALTYVGDSSLDFVFIDGDHDYVPVKADISQWWPKVRSGGIVSGHDYDSRFLGVVRAVNGFATANGLVFGLSCDSVWWMVKP